MLKRILLGTLVLASVASCVPPEPDDDLMRTFDAEQTIMGRVQAAEILRVGVPNDRPALADPGSGEGFVASLGREIADSLGVEAEILPAPNEELIPLIDTGEVDIVFPAVSITEERVRRNNEKHLFLDPYLVAHQRLLIPSSEDLSPVDPHALAGARVCGSIDPETEIDLSEIEPAVRFQEAAVPEECASLMERGEVEASTGSDVVLLGLRELPCEKPRCDRTAWRLEGDQISTFGYGPVIEGGASSWRDYVVNVLEEAQQEGRWQDLYERYLTELSDGRVLDPPGMTVEEAAALFPKEL